MKKQMVMVLLACSALTLTACSNGTDSKTTEAVTEAATTEAATTEAATEEAASEEETTEAATEESTTEAATTEAATTEAASEEATTETASEEETTEAATEEATTEAATEEVTTEAASEEATTEAASEEETTEAATEEATTEEVTTEEATTEEVTTEEATTEEATTEEVTTEEATTEEATTEEVTTEEATTEEATTEEVTTEEATTEEATTEETTTEAASEEETTEAATEETTEEAFDITAVPEYKASDYVTLGEYKGLTVEVEPVAVSDEMVEYYVGLNIPKAEITDGTVESGDTVNIDYEGTKDGVAFDGGTATGYDLEIGSGSFIAGFEDGLIGAAVGEERDLNLTFPEEYHSEELAGQEVVFHVKVNSISRKQELTDEVAAQISEFETAEEYRNDIRSNLEANAEKDIRSNAETSLITQAYDNAKINGYPEEAREYTYNRAKSYYESYASQFGMTLAQLAEAYQMDEETFLSQLKEMADRTLSQEMVLMAIADEEGLEISEDELQEGAAKYAENIGGTAEDLIKQYGEAYIRYSLIQEKALNFLYDNANIVLKEETEAESEATSEAAEETTEAASEEETTEAVEEETTEAVEEETTEAVEEETTEAAEEETTEAAETETETAEAETETAAETESES